MEHHASRNSRKQHTITSVLWWVALIVCLGCLLGLNTLLDP